MEKMIALPNVNEREHVHLVNPCSGDGKYLEAIQKAVKNSGGELRYTGKTGDMEAMCRQLFRENPFAHAVIYGGDGTVHEAVNGIMASGSGETASFSVIPAGSGNDFSAYVNGTAGFTPPDLHRLDLVKVGDRYYANSLNLGFDAQVVVASNVYKHKRGLRGPTSYLAGVVSTLAKKKAVPAKLVLEGIRPFASALDDKRAEPYLVHAQEEDKLIITGDLLLCACANGPFCGGGFKGAPLCSMEDGYMDVMVVRDISRGRFVSLVGKYHDGTYILPDGTMPKKFAQVLEYYQCKKIAISAGVPYCLDGEIQAAAETVTAEIEPGAVWYAAL